jgi:hypothetical protein
MKVSLFAIAILTMTTTSFAKTVLTCSTPGDGLNDVQIVSGNPGKLIISYLNDTEESFILGASTKNLEKGDSDTLVAAKDFDNAFGGAIAEAALICVLPGQKSARLATNGVVYLLNCSK